MIFSMNRGLHQTLIGGIESKDDYCLYRAFRIARNAVNEFKTSFRREKNPGWYVILHALAILFFVNGLWQVLRWFSDFYCWRG